MTEVKSFLGLEPKDVSLEQTFQQLQLVMSNWDDSKEREAIEQVQFS